ncbi:hypothetical protein HAX54_026879 [Datura stramonium]|uniref:Uncharacterized protein n=1 Tax=Datura stramonium TaxID=4076 RepID=A0ABS8Y5Y7_DATST|nr:hypothetical protein [Datura stramonium]
MDRVAKSIITASELLDEDHIPLVKVIPRRVRSCLRKVSGHPIIIPEDNPDSQRQMNPPPVHTLFTRRKRKEAEMTLPTSAKFKQGKNSSPPSTASLHPIDVMDKEDKDLEDESISSEKDEESLTASKSLGLHDTENYVDNKTD